MLDNKRAQPCGKEPPLKAHPAPGQELERLLGAARLEDDGTAPGGELRAGWREEEDVPAPPTTWGREAAAVATRASELVGTPSCAFAFSPQLEAVWQANRTISQLPTDLLCFTGAKRGAEQQRRGAGRIARLDAHTH